MTDDNAEPSLRIRLFDPLGAERGAYQPAVVTLGESLVGQREGFELGYTDFGHNRGVLAVLDENGSVDATTDIDGAVPWPVLEDPRGGIVAVLRRIGNPTDTTPSPIEIAAYDERLNLRFRTQLSTTGQQLLGIGVDRQGNTLVLLDGADRYGSGKVAGIWVDHSGNAGAEFVALEGIALRPPIFLTPRVGKGLFAALDPGAPAAVAWIRQFDPMGKGSEPPDWLAARAGTKLHLARGGRAYAVIHPPRLDTVCHADIEVVAPSGRSCGTAAFPAGQSGPFCGGPLVLGDDGTVVQMVVDSGSDRSSTFRWWAGFLR